MSHHAFHQKPHLRDMESTDRHKKSCQRDRSSKSPPLRPSCHCSPPLPFSKAFSYTINYTPLEKNRFHESLFFLQKKFIGHNRKEEELSLFYYFPEEEVGPAGPLEREKGSLPILLSPRLREGRWCVSTKGGWPVGPAKGKRFLSLTGPLGRRVQRVQRGRIAPQGKRLTGFSGLCRFPTARLSPTHNNLCVALLLQIMFAGVTPVRCAPPSEAMSFICRWRGPPSPCLSGGGKALRDLLCVTSAVPVISSGDKGRYESHSFMEPVKGSREISLKNAAFRQAVRHRVSFRHLPSYTPAPLRGPLLHGKACHWILRSLSLPYESSSFATLKGAQDVTGPAFVSPLRPPSFRAMGSAGMNHIVS